MFIFFGTIYILKIQDYSRTFSIVFIVILTVMVIIERGIVRKLLHSMRAKGYNQKHVLIVGCSELTIMFLEIINRNKEVIRLSNKYGLKTVDVFSFAEEIKELGKDDGVHFTDEGYKALAKSLLSEIKVN